MSVNGKPAYSFPAQDALLAELQDTIVPLRPDMSPRDFLVQLLSFGAHVEHALMVQYLYAAYTLRPQAHLDRKKTEEWRAALLTVAREEMGHLITVQNILTLLGAPPDLGRESSQWAAHYYPFTFSLEPFSRDVLVRFVFAEMPDEVLVDKDLLAHEAPKTKREADKKSFVPVELSTRPDLRKQLNADIDKQRLRQIGHRVGPTYQAIIKLLSDVKRIPDSCFDETSYERQASSDEWSRNYRPAPYQLTPEGDKPKRAANAIADDPLPQASGRDAFVQVPRVATRSDAIEALRQLSEQGEAPHLGSGDLGEPSHYERFLQTYAELLDVEQARAADGLGPLGSDVVANPTTRIDWAEAPQAEAGPKYAYIEAGRAHFLAQIFNQRYRLLLNFLNHTFRISRNLRADRPTVRSMLMHRAFAEMYNLKTLASLLVELPVSEKPGETRLAAPPFELPVTLALPARERDIWREHRELLSVSGESMRRFLKPEDYGLPEYTSAKIAGSAAQSFVSTLLQIDAATLSWLETIIKGAPREESF